MRAVALAICLVLGLPAAGAQCSAESGPGTAALVELYTSEGCSSCPPAERWLATLGPRASAGALVPLALYVDYGYYLGSLRSRKLTPRQRMALVYTPQVLLQGRDFRPWGGPGFDDAVARINAQPARAYLRLEIVGADKEALDVETRASLAAPAEEAALYIGAYRSGPERRVVLEWEGPFGLKKDFFQRRRLALLPGASRMDSGVVAFVQKRRTGEVLQALLRSTC